jgi:CRP-like cAMP-binding protein
MIPPLLETLTEHRFLADLPKTALSRLAEHAQYRDVPEGHRFFAEGEPADRFWLIRDGRVALDLHAPGRGWLIVETLGDGDVLGWSWLCPPYRWRFEAVALHPTRTVELDGTSIRELCDADPAVGYLLSRRLLAVVAERLHATRIRLLDLYAVHQSGPR